MIDVVSKTCRTKEQDFKKQSKEQDLKDTKGRRGQDIIWKDIIYYFIDRIFNNAVFTLCTCVRGKAIGFVCYQSSSVVCQ